MIFKSLYVNLIQEFKVIYIDFKHLYKIKFNKILKTFDKFIHIY